VEILRSRLEIVGPITESRLVTSLHIDQVEIHQALQQLEQQGYVMQGHFAPHETDIEWCERGLLARIHRYTLKRLRAEIEPVSAADFMRFLFHWQHLDDPLEGQAALLAVLQQLEGFPIAASSWEQNVIPARVQGYTPDQLDNLCASGRIVWQRLQRNETSGSRDKNGRKTGAVKSMPVIFCERSNLNNWRSTSNGMNSEPTGLSPLATRALQILRQNGALFFDDLMQEAGLLRSQTEQVLAELVGQGWVTADSFAGLRHLLNPRRHHRGGTQVFVPTGRWSLTRQASRNTPPTDAEKKNSITEHIARTLLRRYGVVFRKLLERESVSVSWRELLYVFRRLEARGEIRGGRFVNGVGGEQFALPEAITALRRIRNARGEQELVTICASDPLNLTGVLTPGERIAAKHTNRILYQHGVPIGVSYRGRVEFLRSVDSELQWEMRQYLIRQHSPATFLPPPDNPV
jgi:ATP-dependent Lhr-like helicase